MVNPSRIKGTVWETELLPALKEAFGEQVERAPLKGVLDCGDYAGVPFLVEAKSTKVPKFLEWARVARAKANRHRGSKWWAICWHGDRRIDGLELAILPLDMFLELAESWYHQGLEPEDLG